jgi:ABC transporter family protein
MTLEMRSRSPAALSTVDVCRALASASRTPRGNGLVFRPARARSWVRTVGGDSFIVALDELPRFWPSPDCAIGVESPASGQAPRLLPLGRTREGVVVGPLLEEHQGRHLAILGETGMGKSSLLIALARRALSSAGGVVMDPLGETVRSLREELGLAEQERCLWVAPDASEITLNALEGIGASENDDPVRSERRLNDLVHALRRVRAGRYSESGYWGPRLEEMVTRALRAAAALPDGTLVDAHTLLASSARLGRPIPVPASEAVRDLADRIRDRPEDADGARRLLHEVVRSPILARQLCAPHPTVRTRDLVAPGRIVLISGDAARVGESTARYLLSVLLALVWSELLARSETPKTFVVLDEAQWFSHESLAEMLRLGRRKNVHVILATQAVATLPDAVREAVWTNASDFVAFRGSPEEAREFERAVPGISAEEILGLPRGEAAVLIGKGESVRWLRTIRRPPARASSGPGHGIGRSGAPSPPVETPPRLAPAPPTPTLDRIFVELLHDGAEVPGEGPLVVDLVEFRRRVDPRGDGIREAGGILSRSGALTRVERPAGGHRWVIDRSRLADVVSRRGATSPGGSVSRLPQPS